MWTKIILCLSLFLAFDTDAHSNNKKNDDIPEYEIHNLHDSEIVYDVRHAKEHLTDSLNEEHLENMTEEEMAFHFFNEHDYNKDKLLDGIEIMSSLTHSFSEEHIIGPLPPAEHLKLMSDEERKKLDENRSEKFLDFISSLIDSVLRTSDLNNDGYLNYIEFNHARETQKSIVQERSGAHKHVKND